MAASIERVFVLVNRGRKGTMTDQPSGSQPNDPTNDTPPSNLEKDPDQWVTGEEPMTGAQQSYLTLLAQEAGEEVPEGLTKADASKKIDELQERTGRGKDKQ